MQRLTRTVRDLAVAAFSPNARLGLVTACLCFCSPVLAHAAGGPLGIDHRIGFDQSGIWSRHDQFQVEDLTLATVVGGALWEGGESRLGRTCWQADVLAGFALGAAAGYYAHKRSSPFFLEYMPHAFEVGLMKGW